MTLQNGVDEREQIDGKTLELVFGKTFVDSHLTIEGEVVPCYSARVEVEAPGEVFVELELPKTIEKSRNLQDTVKVRGRLALEEEQ